MRLSSLIVYPIKGAAGIPLHGAAVETHGLAFDRRWMLIDPTGVFLSQRQLPAMARLRPRLEPDGLRVEAPGMPPLELASTPEAGARVRVRVWDDRCDARAVGPEADRWFTRVLGTSCRLVHLPADALRRVDPDYAAEGDRVGFADGFPFLLTSESSLDDLNSRLERPLPMDRFRPNLVVRGAPAYAEDDWSLLRIGGIRFRVVKPCARCAVTTVDQRSGAVGEEPLRTLARYRRVGGQVLFGQNLIQDTVGRLTVGDPVEVLV